MIKIVFKNALFIEGEFVGLFSIKLKNGNIVDNINQSEILYIENIKDQKSTDSEIESDDFSISFGEEEPLIESEDILFESTKKIVDEKIKEAQEEKNNLFKNLKPKIENNYGLPNFSAFKVSKQHTDKKVRHKNTRNK